MQMKDEMTKDQGEGAAQEQEAEKQFNELSAAKKAEIAAATEAIEKKSEEQGKLAVAVAEAKGELSDTQKELGANQEFLANMGEMCKTKTAEWEERSKLRNEELVALADTIKILNDDDALDIFKSQLSGPATSNMQTSFLQRSSTRDIRREAVQILGQHKNVQVALIANLLKSGGGFDKVINLIDTLLGELKTEQNDDDEQLKWCNKEFDATADSVKGVVREIEGLTSNIDKQTADNEAFASTIKATKEAIENLDKAVAEATEQRKEDNAEYTENKGMNAAAHQLLGMAKNRLNKFYNPKLYKPPPQRELTEEERIMQANGMDIGTVAPTTVAGTNIQAVPYFLQFKYAGAPPPPPETWGEHKSHEGSTGVIGLMDKLINELESDMKQADLDENTAQAEYTKLMEESAAKRKADAGVLTDAESNLANGESNLQQLKADRATKNDELTALKEYTQQLHNQCDFLTKNYDLRKDARAREGEALNSAKAVLR